MSKFQDSAYLKATQYAGADKLAARIKLHDRFTVNYVDYPRWFFDILLAATPQQATVLEVGAGRGDIWKINAAPERRDLLSDETEDVDELRQQVQAFGRIPAGWNITLTDISGGMLADNRAHLGEALAARFTYAEANVQSLPYPDASFDTVIANYMLYHVPDLDGALKELRRVLKPTGVLLAMTNGSRHMLEIGQFVERAGISETASKGGLMNTRLGFNLQNGKSVLDKVFGNAVRLDFATELLVTEVQPVLDYVASMLENPDEVMNSAGGLALASLLEQHLTENGAIRISKETGLFVAR